MLALLLTIAALSVGPLIHQLVLSRPTALALLDAFTVLTVGGLVLLQIIPGCLQVALWPAALAALLGIASPVLAEELLERAAEKVHRLFLAVAMLGIGLHSFFDGIALANPTGEEHTSLLAIGIVIHSVPVGLTVSWLLLSNYGMLAVVGTILFMVVATIAGFIAAPHLPGLHGGQWLAALQAFVAGSLVHVLVHRPHLQGIRAAPLTRLLAALAGTLAASGLLVFLLISHVHERPQLWMILAGSPLLLLFLFLHHAPRRWLERLAPWRQHRHHHGHE